jgi:KDO2-lipid IV(A) lauroyltransferase
VSDRTATVRRRLAWRLEALGYDFLSFLLGRLPLDAASAVGGGVLELLGPMTRRQRTVLRNLQLAFPEATEDGRRRLARQHWNQLGRTFVEFPLMDRLTPRSGRVEVLGLEHLRRIAAAGEPAVLVSGHLSNWEVMMAVIVESGLKCRVSYRPVNNPHVDRRITESRRRYGVELFAAKGGDGTRELLAALNRGEAVAMLNDQRDNAGVEGPFFGRMVRTAPGPARFGLKYGARLIPLSVVRLGGARFRATIHEPILLDVSGDRARDTAAAVAKINAFVEARIRERPAEWMWAHRRWPLECYREATAGLPTAPAASPLRRQGPS